MIHLSITLYPSNDLAKLIASDLNQTEKVKQVFRTHPTISFTAEQMHRLAFTDLTPITSIRRCLSTLKNAGYLEKLETDKRKGKYGISICQYRLKTTNHQIKLF